MTRGGSGGAERMGAVCVATMEFRFSRQGKDVNQRGELQIAAPPLHSAAENEIIRTK